MERIKGRITREQTVWCWSILNTNDPTAKLISSARNYAECHQHYQHAGPVAGVARESGWRVEPKYGWMCQTCVKALRSLRAGAVLGTKR